MASVMGFQMKNIKNTLGIEGYGCTGTMYLDGKKIGTYADYGDGGCEDINYISKDAKHQMMIRVIEFAKKNPNPFIENLYNERPNQYKKECERFKKYCPYIPDEDINIRTMASNSEVYIVSKFLDIYELEKKFKSYNKKGYRAIACDGNMITAYPTQWSDEKIKESIKPGYTLYMSLDDFNI